MPFLKRKCNSQLLAGWSIGLRLVDPTARREQWNTGKPVDILSITPWPRPDLPGLDSMNLASEILQFYQPASDKLRQGGPLLQHSITPFKDCNSGISVAILSQ
jgi:hypothetical protein